MYILYQAKFNKRKMKENKNMNIIFNRIKEKKQKQKNGSVFIGLTIGN